MREVALWLCFLWGLGTVLPAQVDREIVIRDGVDLFLSSFDGAGGGEARQSLERCLKLTGLFHLTARDRAQFVLTARYSDSALSAVLTDARTQREVLVQTFGGAPEEAGRKLADAVLQKTVGVGGMFGCEVAFVSEETGSKEIYLMKLDGTRVRQLTRDGTISTGPKISARGDAIVYTSYKSGYPDVVLLDLAAGKVKTLASFPGLNSGAALSPDGQTVALILSKTGNPELFTMLRAGGVPRQLTKTCGVEADPAWSPDGNQIVFVSDDRGSTQLFVMAAGGGAPVRLPISATYATEPSWSPDGQKIAFTTRAAGVFTIAVLDRTSGRVTLLTEGASFESPAWTANSRFLVAASEGQLFLIDSLTRHRVSIPSGLSRCSQPSCSIFYAN